jgi:glycosyltransferase involved in cell wall biosynthesis
MRTAILIPCYNEELTILKVINDFKNELPNADIYVYDNNSSDKTYEIATSVLPENYVCKEPRQGKGNTVRAMFQDIDADIYVIIDGDDTYPANAIHDLIKPVLHENFDMVIGDRLSNHSYAIENKRNFHNFGNNLVRNMINFLFRSKLNDIMTGYRVFNKFFVKTFPILSKGFEIETEMTIFSLHNNYKVKEIPIIYKDRPEGSESKLNTYHDGFKVIMTILKLFRNYRPMLFFSLIGITISLLGITVGLPVIKEYFTTGIIYRIPSAILSTSLIIIALLAFFSGLILDTMVVYQKYLHEQMAVLFKCIEKK